MDLIERAVKKNYIYRGKIVSLRCDDAVLPDGKPCKREVVEHPGGAAVLCVQDGNAVLVRQYRYAYGEELLEIPAGKLEKGEDPMSAARRELEEETGLRAGKLELLYVLYPTPGYTNEKIYIYLADEVSPAVRHLDEDEFLDVVRLPVDELLGRIERGELRDGKTAVGALLYAARRQEKNSR